MAVHIRDLIPKIPIDTEKDVSKARSRYNNAVRQLLRQETGLRLSRNSDVEEEEQETHTVKVSIKCGWPAELERISIDDDKLLAILIAPWRAQLNRLYESSSAIRINLIGSLPKDLVREGRVDDIEMKLNGAAEFAELLLKIADQFDLVKELHAVEDDILGVYTWTNSAGQTTAETQLFWMIVGLIAQLLGVSVSGLTVVVLAHELAHAYTHLGMDIDGYRWRDDDFKRTERAVKEGLAQYYTHQVVARLKYRMPEALQAYNTLLPHQPPAYRVQQQWVDDGATPEEIRLAMVSFRRAGKTTLDEFEAVLEQARQTLKQRPRRGAALLDD